jgi:hypothetical protein
MDGNLVSMICFGGVGYFGYIFDAVLVKGSIEDTLGFPFIVWSLSLVYLFCCSVA